MLLKQKCWIKVMRSYSTVQLRKKLWGVFGLLKKRSRLKLSAITFMQCYAERHFFISLLYPYNSAKQIYAESRSPMHIRTKHYFLEFRKDQSWDCYYLTYVTDLIGFIKKSSLYNFPDDNTITVFEKDIALLKEILQNEAEIAAQWFKDNFMIVNPGKFQALIINRFGKMKNKHEMHIDNKKITSEDSVKLLGIEIDNSLKFDNHVSTLCRKAGSQLNAILVDSKNTLVFLKKRL